MSPPSSSSMFGPPSGQVSACSAHHQYSSSVSPFQAKTGMPARLVGGAVGADDDRGGRLVLRREDVARRPAHLGAERDERLDQHRGLDRHVQRARDAGAAQRLRVRRTRGAAPSGPASRARRARFPCVPTLRATGRRPCTRWRGALVRPSRSSFLQVIRRLSGRWIRRMRVCLNRWYVSSGPMQSRTLAANRRVYDSP